ncbi:MAG: 2-amino-4-hydroxy-6-hydroxymethyldihydropteridine diphosphokinase [Treponema sp.]
METVLLGLGSNQGDSKAIFAGALARLEHLLSGLCCSSVYITAPQEYTAQNDFHNMVVSGAYAGTPVSLLTAIQDIEREYGRNRVLEIPKGPRLLDIDILFFGSRQVSMRQPPLTIPHPAVSRRAFVLIPLLELYPDYADPCTGEPLAAALAALPDQGVHKIGPVERY